MELFNLKEHQIEAIDKLKVGKILRGGTGSGKTATSLFFVKEYYSDHKLYIITTAKKRNDEDWEKEILKVFGKEIEVIVDSWNRITKYVDVIDSFFIFDEQKSIGNGSWAKSFVKIAKRNKWIMLSATPGDKWEDYINVFLANGFYKNRTMFINKHIIYNPYITSFPSIKGYRFEDELLALKTRVLVEMKMKRHTIRKESYIFVGYSKEMYDRVYKDRWNIYSDQPIKNASELVHTLRKVLSISTHDKLYFIKKIYEEHNKIIIFYNYNYELDMLKEYLSDNDILYSEYNGKKHEEIPKGPNWVYLVQYIAGAEGWNCIETNTICFFSPNYSYRIMEQSKGRIDRLNTEYSDLYYFHLLTKSKLDYDIMDILKKKKKFNEKKWSGMNE